METDPESAVTKITVLNEAGTFKFRAVVDFFDRLAHLGGIHDHCLHDFPPRPVKVKAGDRVLGYAALSFEEQPKRLWASFFLDPANPERLEIENRSGRLYPKMVYVYEMKTNRFHPGWVELTFDPPSDGRILPLGEPTL